MNGAVILETLERVAGKCGDPTPLVYDRLFTQHPDVKAFFVLDTDDGVKGHMLQEALENLIDYSGEGQTAGHFIRAELVNHDNLGIPPDVFRTFFPVLRDTFKEVLGDEWTAEMETAWRGLLADLDGMIAEEAAGMANAGA